MDKLKKHFMEVFELSSDVTLDLPLVMMVANDKLYIENHKGISYFQTEEIKVKIKNGSIVIKGEKLFINEIDSESLSISGKILIISYENRMEGMASD